MLYARSVVHDPVTGILTVRYSSPSGTSWQTYEYRDVPSSLAVEIARARPHVRGLLEDRVLPVHPSRRAGSGRWRSP